MTLPHEQDQARIDALLADAAYEALVALDADRRVLSLNKSARTLFRAHDAVGRSLADVLGSSELDGMVLYALENGEDDFEVQTTIAGRFYRVRSHVERADGAPQRIGLALQDVTDLVRLNRARRDMVANISHELRTPIANIRLIIDGLFMDEDKPKRKKSIASLKAIGKETDSLLWLVQELLDLSMIESGQAIVRMVEVALDELISTSVERLQDQMDAKDLHVLADVPTSLRVLCDSDLMRRVVINLLHNAIKWSAAGKVIRIHGESLGEYVVVTVRDEGPGVPDDQTDRIFERFYQVDASRSGGEGSGLGLSICKHIVEAHGGRIWAEGRSATGGGGVFGFSLLNADFDSADEPSALS